MNKQYADNLTKNLGKTQPYHFEGDKCAAGCKNFSHYETKHHKNCPFYKGSLSEKMDIAESQLKESNAEVERLREENERLNKLILDMSIGGKTPNPGK